jgi:TldD protein
MIRHFDRFGVTEGMIRQALGAALSRGGDFADVFFQHRVERDLALEDGAVNRAFASVELGVGVRVVKGDQTGYGYTEDLSLPALLDAARTAAAIAEGPSREAPLALHLARTPQGRYPARVPGEAAGATADLPLLEDLNRRLVAADASVRDRKSTRLNSSHEHRKG